MPKQVPWLEIIGCPLLVSSTIQSLRKHDVWLKGWSELGIVLKNPDRTRPKEIAVRSTNSHIDSRFSLRFFLADIGWAQRVLNRQSSSLK